MTPNQPYPTLYMTDDVETAHREGNQVFYQALQYSRLGPGKLPAPEETVLIGVHLRLSRMLDLRDPQTLAAIGTSLDEIAAPWKTVPDAPTQRLGEVVARQIGLEGMIYNSAQNPGGTCFVVFTDKLILPSFVEFRSGTDGIPNARHPT